MLRSATATSVWAILAAACGGGSSTPDATVSVDAAAVVDAPPRPDSAPTPDAAPTVDAFVADALPAGATCAEPISLAPGAGASGSTSLLPDVATASCSNGSNFSPEEIYQLDLGADPVDLTATASVDEGATDPFDVVLHARTDCASAGTEVACVDSGWSERLEVLAQTGVVYLFVDGTNQHGSTNAGSYTLTTSVRAVVAASDACDPTGISNRCEAGTRCVSSVCVADSPTVACDQAVGLTLAPSDSVTATTYGYAADHYSGSCAYQPSGFPEHIYSFTTAGAAAFTATTDFAETELDTVLYLRSACDGSDIACHDDVDLAGNNLTSTLSISNLPAGTYYLFVDASSASPGTGSYRLDVAITN